MRRQRRSPGVRPIVLLILLTTLGGGAGAQPVPESLLRQIEALQREKASRTPVQQKLSSRLVYAERVRRGLPIAPGVPTLRTGVFPDSDGRVAVDVVADVTPALLAHLESLGGQVVASVPARRALRARLPLPNVEALASRREVDHVRPADPAFTRKTNTSQGDGAHWAAPARAALGIDGTGVTIGVLSDGVDSLAALQMSGDLPAVTVLPGQAGSGSEGTAMLEIVYDLAPGADLMFATAFSGQASFASNVLALGNAGADVIVDDVGYFAEAVFQDDDVAAAVDQVVADGAIYLSAAGNSGNLDDGTAGVFEGDFVAGASFHGNPGHDYGGDIRNRITVDSPFAFTLQWSDPLVGSGNDYDLYLTNENGGMIVAVSNDPQNGNDDPFEIIPSPSPLNDVNRSLIVVLYSGSPRYFHLNANRGRLEYATTGQTWGHAAARGALGIAAVDARFRESGFLGDESVETYSSDGPRRVFFEADGSPITPGDFSSTGGELRDKPDLAGADCVRTATPGFATFCGTSAAAPHVAATAALLIERAGGPASADPDLVRSALAATALDIEAAGADRDSGAGIAHAEDAANALCGVDADCDDGLFCTGTETCEGGSCAPDPGPVCEAPTTLCDETGNACVACLTDGDCDDGLFCTGAETCTAGSCSAGAPPPCPLCDEGADTCVQCLTDPDCDDGLFCTGTETCEGGSCTPDPGPVCEAPTPLCDEGAQSCFACIGGGDCGEEQACDAGVCVSLPAVPLSPLAPAPWVLALALLGLGARRSLSGR